MNLDFNLRVVAAKNKLYTFINMFYEGATICLKTLISYLCVLCWPTNNNFKCTFYIYTDFVRNLSHVVTFFFFFFFYLLFVCSHFLFPYFSPFSHVISFVCFFLHLLSTTLFTLVAWIELNKFFFWIKCVIVNFRWIEDLQIISRKWFKFKTDKILCFWRCSIQLTLHVTCVFFLNSALFVVATSQFRLEKILWYLLVVSCFEFTLLSNLFTEKQNEK